MTAQTAALLLLAITLAAAHIGARVVPGVRR